MDSHENAGFYPDPEEIIAAVSSVSPISPTSLCNTKFWYKPNASREDAIVLLQDRPPGTFVVRCSSSFPGAYGLAVKVDVPPLGVCVKSDADLVRHFLIESTDKGVKLKGCDNEPTFGSLSTLVYQHSITPLALPCRLILPTEDVGAFYEENVSPIQNMLMEEGTSTTVEYLQNYHMETLTGPAAAERAVENAVQRLQEGTLTPVKVSLRVSQNGVVLTDMTRKNFFRKHYSFSAIKHCGFDPQDRRNAGTRKGTEGDKTADESLPRDCAPRIFVLVVVDTSEPSENMCEVFAEHAHALITTTIVQFIARMSCEAQKTISEKATTLQRKTLPRATSTGGMERSATLKIQSQNDSISISPKEPNQNGNVSNSKRTKSPSKFWNFTLSKSATSQRC